MNINYNVIFRIGPTLHYFRFYYIVVTCLFHTLSLYISLYYLYVRILFLVLFNCRSWGTTNTYTYLTIIFLNYYYYYYFCFSYLGWEKRLYYEHFLYLVSVRPLYNLTNTVPIYHMVIS